MNILYLTNKLYFGLSCQNPIWVFSPRNFKMCKLHPRMKTNCRIEDGIRISQSILLIEFLPCKLN